MNKKISVTSMLTVTLFSLFCITPAFSYQDSGQSDQAIFTLRTDDPEREIDFLPTKTVYAKPIDLDETVTTFSLATSDGEIVPVIFFDRNKNNVIIVGQGFPGTKEGGKWIARLFYDYDVVLFDYRWRNTSQFLFRLSTIRHPIDTFFLREKQEVIAVTKYIQQHKNYNDIIALGECYSCFTFVSAQCEAEKRGEKLFTKMILDSCWYDSRDWAERISLDPWLPFSPQTGGAPQWLQHFLQAYWVHKSLARLLDIFIPEMSIDPCLQEINVPLLFIHGRNDKLVPFNDAFEKIWPLAQSEKALLATPFEHSYNGKNSWLYRKVCTCFIKANEGQVGERLIYEIASLKEKKFTDKKS